VITDDAPCKRRKYHAFEPAARSTRKEIFNELSAGGVASADHHWLKGKTWKAQSLERRPPRCHIGGPFQYGPYHGLDNAKRDLRRWRLRN
jgi:hypothetical protein